MFDCLLPTVCHMLLAGVVLWALGDAGCNTQIAGRFGRGVCCENGNGQLSKRVPIQEELASERAMRRVELYFDLSVVNILICQVLKIIKFLHEQCLLLLFWV